MLRPTLTAILLTVLLALPVGGLTGGGFGTGDDGSGAPSSREFRPWIRDRDGNGIDDLIDAEMLKHPGGSTHIYVHYDRHPTLAHRTALGRIVEVSYAPRYIDVLCALDVPFSSLTSIRDLDGVIMVEKQLPMRTQLDVSTRAIKMRDSTRYTDNVERQYRYDGNGQVVAVIDTGVNDDHPTFEEAFLGGYYATPIGGAEVNPVDEDGHGTHVAGIILGRGGGPDDPDNTYRGVAHEAKLIDVKIQETRVGGFMGQTFLRAMEWCIDQRTSHRRWNDNYPSFTGINIISVALGDGSNDDGSSAPAQIVNAAHDAGILVVCAVGNGNQEGIQAPASADKAIAVGAVNDQNTIDRDDDRIWPDSNRGPRADDGDADGRDELKPDVVAPGVDIMSASHLHLVGDDYVSMTGTSMAAAHVAGMMAVLRQASSGLTLDQGSKNIRLILKRTSTFPPGTNLQKSMPLVDDKWNSTYGWGVIDVYRAVWYAKTPAQIAITRIDFSKPEPNEGDLVAVDITVAEQAGIDILDGTVRAYRETVEQKNLVLERDLNGLTGSTSKGFTIPNYEMKGGQNKVIVTVTGMQGAGDLQRDATVNANNKPSAVLYTDDSNRREYFIVPGQKVLFHGNASSDPEHHALLYRFDLGDGTVYEYSTRSWVQHAFPNGRYTVSLQVRDEKGAVSDPNQCLITANLDPTAMAGDPIVAGKDQRVSFHGTAYNDGDHNDPNDAIVLFEWDFEGDGTYEFQNTDDGYATHVYRELGDYTAWFRVTDRWGAQGEDSVSVRIVEGMPPKAEAGEDMVGLVDEEVMFSGAGTDEDGTIVTYQWNFGDGSGWKNYDSGDAVYIYRSTGTYTARFRVVDNDGNEDIDSITVRIHLPPEVKIRTPGNDASFSSDEDIRFDGGESFDPDGTQLTFHWSSDRDGFLGDTATFTRQLTFGRHRITLTVTDGDGASESVTVSIAVRDATNTPPSVSITSPANNSWHLESDTIRFSASGQDPDGDNLTYLWEVGEDTYPGRNADITLPPGKNVVRVVADDGRGGIAIAYVTVNINRKPMAVIRGLKVFYNDGEPITFDASDSHDPDGDRIVRYTWHSDIIGIFYQNTSTIVVTPLPMGDHTITLTVQDEHGATASASTLVVVKDQVDWSIALSASKTTDASSFVDPAFFTITARNDKGTGKMVVLEAENVPGGWTVTFLTQTNDIIPNGLWSLGGNAQDTFRVKVEVPRTAPVNQPRTITITATIGDKDTAQQDSIQLAIVPGVYRALTLTTNAESVLVNNAGDSAEIELTIINNGNAVDTFILGANSPPGWRVTFTGGGSIEVQRDSEQKVKVRITSDSNAKRRTVVDIPIWCSSNNDDRVNSSISVRLRVLAEKDDKAPGFTLPLMVPGLAIPMLLAKRRRR